jgi:hypothetical protein
VRPSAAIVSGDIPGFGVLCSGHGDPGRGWRVRGGWGTLVAYESDEPMRVTFNVTGPLIWLDENGEPNGHFDVFDYIKLCRDHYEKVGIGADYVDKLFR